VRGRLHGEVRGAVIPEKAGIHSATHWICAPDGVDSRFLGNNQIDITQRRAAETFRLLREPHVRGRLLNPLQGIAKSAGRVRTEM
jgi:hypothetical protein